MYSHTFFVTSVRAIFFAPQIALNASLSCLGAKIPFPAFFWARAFFLPVAFCAVLPKRPFSAVIFFSAAFVIVVFFVVVVATVVATVVFVVVVMAREGCKCTQTLSLEPK